MFARLTQSGVVLLAALAALSAAPQAYAQCRAPGVSAFSDPAAYSYREIDGVVYYYDKRGQPLFKDDYAHYNYPRRFYYRNGGWVLLSSGRGYYARHPAIGQHQPGPRQSTHNGQSVSGHSRTVGHASSGRGIGAHTGGAHASGHTGSHGHR